jgi:translocation and assembly module TamA
MRMRFALLLAVSALFLVSCKSPSEKLCENIYLKEGELKLSANERVLVCGSQKGLEGWRDVPLPQAQYQIGVILQNKGFFNPRFERVKDELFVWSGPQGEIKVFEVQGGEGVVNAFRKRNVIGEPMTPEKLDEIETWADTEMRQEGFACPQVEIEAQAWRGKVVAKVDPGERQTVASIKLIGLESLNRDILYRYQAIEVGDEYDVRKTQLTVARLLADGIAESAYFTTKCRGKEVDLTLRATLGSPKLLTFGIGGSTEELPFVDLRFRNSRLDGHGSSLTSTVHVSPRVQSWNTTADLYYLPISKRMFLSPRFLLKRESERAFEVNSAKAGGEVGRMFDMWDIRWRGTFGPTLNYVNTVQGVGPDDVSYLSWEGHARLMHHNYESTIRDQVEGWEADFDYRGQREGLGSYLNVDRYEADFKYLWNVYRLSPPFLVLASRFELIGVDAEPVVDASGNVPDTNDILPTEYRVFYGGDDNLRGFGRKALNNFDFGYLTAAYAGFELRLIEELPYRLQPFLLYDVAKLGTQRFTWSRPTFSSTGIGLRWASPFGTLRGSAARGRIHSGDDSVAQYQQEMVYFLSFGQEF